MDSRIQELLKLAKEKFGLENYYLGRHSLFRSVNHFNETIYTLNMEWFPNHVTEQLDDESNPDGAAIIEMNVQTKKVERAIFVNGNTYAKGGALFANRDITTVIQWIEKETDLIYGEQFQLHKESDGELLFIGCFQGIAVSPSGWIDVECDQDGILTLFSIYGEFPTKEMVRKEHYSLTLEQVEDVAEQQLKRSEYPSYEQKRLFSMYGVEEIYIRNDDMSIISFDSMIDGGAFLEMDKKLVWNAPLREPFKRSEIKWTWDITPEQAFSCEPSPDTLPITEEEKEQCVQAVIKVLRQEYPNDSGKWILKTLYRDKGYIHAMLKMNNEDGRIFQRKMKILIDANSFRVIHYMDNECMLEQWNQFQAPEQATVTKLQAYDKLKNKLQLTPTYVYDIEQQRYILCGKLSCKYGVNAANGELVLLSELR